MHIFQKLEDLPNDKEQELIRKYCEVYNWKPFFVSGNLNLTRGICRKDKNTVFVVVNRFQRKVITMLGGRAKLPSELLDNAKDFCALKDMFLALNQRQVACYMFNRVAALKDRSFYAKSAQVRMKEGLNFPKIMENPALYEKNLKEILEDKYSPEYVQELSKIPQIIKKGRKYAHQDYQSALINVIDGRRVVPGQPENAEHTIHVFGRCGVFGYAVEDADTMPSYLQRLLSENGYANYKVINHGLWGADNHIINYNMMYEARSIKKGDIVIIYMRHYNKPELKVFMDCGLQYYDCTRDYHEYPESKMSFYDKPGHMTAKGYKIVANIIFDRMKETEFGRNHKATEESMNSYEGYFLKYIEESTQDDFLKDLEAYLQDIRKNYLREEDQNAVIGSIIMNCNPFTRGHKYLIQYASERVDKLFVFILEEDKSFFKFADRFEMVKRGTADIGNVVVLPSREFMISAMTFPEYFMKDYSQTREVDVTQDLSIFGEYIAPALNIKVRFAGQEPIDLVTQSYNRNMERILPTYGIRFEEIPRLTVDGENVISASKVRKLLKEKKYDDLKRYVPDTTFDYLMEHYV